MIIEYTDTAKSTKVEGNDFTALLFNRKHNTNIIYELWSVVKENERKPFEEMYEILREAYKNRQSRSRCEIYRHTDSMIEVNNKGVFPNILITKNNV